MMVRTESAAMGWRSEHFSNDFDESLTTTTCFVRFLIAAESAEKGREAGGLEHGDTEAQ